jgi:hypothetical protein
MEQASRLGSRTQFYPPHLESHCTRFSRWYQYYGFLRCVPLYTTIWHHIQKAVILVSTNMWSSHAPAHQNLSDALLGKERDEQLKHSVTTVAESGFGPRWKKFRPPPLAHQARVDRIKIFSINRKDWLSVEERTGLGLKGLIGTIDK